MLLQERTGSTWPSAADLRSVYDARLSTDAFLLSKLDALSKANAGKATGCISHAVDSINHGHAARAAGTATEEEQFAQDPHSNLPANHQTVQSVSFLLVRYCKLHIQSEITPGCLQVTR